MKCPFLTTDKPIIVSGFFDLNWPRNFKMDSFGDDVTSLNSQCKAMSLCKILGGAMLQAIVGAEELF